MPSSPLPLVPSRCISVQGSCHVYWPGLAGSDPCATPAKIEERQSVCAGNIHKLMQVRRRYGQLGNVKCENCKRTGVGLSAR